MANARSRFDAIAAYLRKAHEARALTVRGRPCVGIDGATFLALHRDGMGFRLDGRVPSHTLALPGTRAWHPLDPTRVAPGWVFVPTSQAARWDRLAIDAFRAARTAAYDRRSATLESQIRANEDPPPSTATSLSERVAAAIARGFSGLSLVRAA
jgi:hypothetical protein